VLAALLAFMIDKTLVKIDPNSTDPLAIKYPLGVVPARVELQFIIIKVKPSDLSGDFNCLYK
jgi:hypothetical protein